MATCCSDVLGPTLNRLLLCAEQALEDCGVPVCRSFLYAGPQVPWDECCDCGTGVGQLWVAVSTVSPLNPDQIKCATPQESTIEIGVLRCAVTQDDQGRSPDPDELSMEALAVWRDRAIVVQAIRGCFASEEELDDWTLGDWRGLAGGGCVGGALSMTFRFTDICPGGC